MTPRQARIERGAELLAAGARGRAHPTGVTPRDVNVIAAEWGLDTIRKAGGARSEWELIEACELALHVLGLSGRPRHPW